MSNIPKPVYVMSEPHLSGYRVILGYNTLEDASQAHDAAVNALPELLAIKAERDRAQRACEQMGARIASLENLIRAMLENEPDDIVADVGYTVLDEWRYNARAMLAASPYAALKETGQ